MSFKDFLKKANGYVSKNNLRKLIDDDDRNAGLEKVYKSSKKNEVEEFLAQVARTVANLMQMKKFVIPNGEIYLPDRYIVYLSTEIDREFQGRKRELFIKGLQYLSEEAAIELVGKTAAEEISVKVELRTDGTLEADSQGYRVEIVDSKTGETEIFESHSNIDEDEEKIVQIENDRLFSDNDATVVEEYATFVEPSTLYYVDVSYNHKFEKRITVDKREIKIGRPSRGASPEIELSNDKISRHHASLIFDEAGNVWLIHKGQNPTKVNGIKCNFEEKRLVKPEQQIEIEGYFLILRK